MSDFAGAHKRRKTCFEAGDLLGAADAHSILTAKAAIASAELRYVPRVDARVFWFIGIYMDLFQLLTMASSSLVFARLLYDNSFWQARMHHEFSLGVRLPVWVKDSIFPPWRTYYNTTRYYMLQYAIPLFIHAALKTCSKHPYEFWFSVYDTTTITVRYQLRAYPSMSGVRDFSLSEFIYTFIYPLRRHTDWLTESRRIIQTEPLPIRLIPDVGDQFILAHYDENQQLAEISATGGKRTPDGKLSL